MPPTCPPAAEAPTVAPREPAEADAGPPALPGYEVLGELGRGGMGVVYQARQVALNRVVALKMILSGAHAGAAELARFKAEAEAAARLQHPNIVQIYEVGQHQGLPYFSLEFCAGGSLAARLDGTPLPPRQAAGLIAVLAHAVHAAHLAGVVHRDLKPANVLLVVGQDSNPVGKKTGLESCPTNWVPKITDFGLAKRLDDASGQTQSGTILGTPSYMAPEQAAGKSKAIGPAADVYALGAILYELLTGRPPFRAETPLDTVLQVLSDEPVPPGRLVSRLPRDLETVCLKCLHKEPARRYASTAALADDLEAYRDGRPIAARPVGRLERAWRWCRRNRALAAAAALVALTLVAGSVVSTAFGIRANDNAEQARQAQEAAQANAEQARQAQRAAEDARAEEARQRETAQGLERSNRRQLIDLLVSTGNRLLREDDPGAALPWLAEAARRDPDDPAHAGRVDGALALLPRPVYFWPHERAISALAVSPDGRRAVTGCDDGTARLWDLDTGEPVGPPLKVDGAVLAVAFSPDGKRVAGAGGAFGLRGQVRVWEAATGAAVGEPVALPGTALFVGFSADGTRLLTAELTLGGNLLEGEIKGPRFTYRAREAATGKTLGQATTTPPLNVLGPRARSFAAALGAGSYVHAGTGRVLAVYGAWAKVVDLADGRTVGGPLDHRRPIWFARWNADGSRTITLDTGGLGKVREAATGRVRDLAVGSGEFPLDAAFNGRGEVALAFADGTVQRYRLADGQPVPGSRHQLGAEGWNPRFDADAVLLTGLSTEGTARVWEADGGQPVTPVLRHGGTLTCAAFAADGRRLLVGAHDGSVRVWDLALSRAGQPRATIYNGAFPHTLVDFDPDGRCLVLGQGRLRRFNPATARDGNFLTPRGDASVWATALSPDRTRLAAGTNDGAAQVLDATTFREVRAPLKTPRWVLNAAFSPDGRLLATLASAHDPRSSRYFAAQLWDLATGKSLLPPPPLGGFLDLGAVICMAFSPDGRWFATGGGRLTLGGVRGEVRLYEAATGKAVGQPLPLSPGKIPIGLAFSPDGRRLAVLSLAAVFSVSGELALWDVPAAAPALPPVLLTGMPHACAFDPSGGRLAVAAGNALQVLDPAGKRLHLLRHRGEVTAVRFERQGRVLLSVCEGEGANEVCLWDAVTGEALRPPLRHPAKVESAALSPDGRFLVTAGDRNGDRRLRVWDLAADPARGGERERLARLLSCQEVDGTTPVPVPADRLAADWEQLRRAAPDQLTPAAAQVIAWHDQQAGRLVAAEAWAAAARQYELLAARQPTNAWWHYQAFGCYLAADDRDGRRRHGEALLRLNRGMTDLQAIDQVVESCLIAPDTLADPAPALRLAKRLETAKATDPSYPWFAVARGIALYREGRLDEAAAWIEKVRIRKPKPAFCAVHADLFLAMIRARQHQGDEARKLLDDAARALDAVDRGIWRNEWVNRVQCQAVLREARQTVGAP
jgi:WD40 repeat protein